MKRTLSRSLLLACLLTGLASVASAQDAAVAPASLRADDAANEARTQPFCLQETGTRIHQRVRPLQVQADDKAMRATACATSQPGRSWSRRDIERTGAFDLADALRQLDPSIH